MPEIMLNSVVLPAPLGPMTPIISPAGTVRVTSVRILIPPTAKLRFCTSSAAELGGMAKPSWCAGPARAAAGRPRGTNWWSAGLGRLDVPAVDRVDQFRDP